MNFKERVQQDFVEQENVCCDNKMNIECCKSHIDQRLTIAGSFGFGNIGDEAISLAMEDLASEKLPGLNHDLLSRYKNPPLPGIVGLGRKYSHQLRSLVGQPLLFSGGGIIENNRGCVLLRCSGLLSKTFWGLLAVAVEPGVRYGWLIHRQLRRLLVNSKLLTVRDVLSREVLRQLLPGKSAIEVTGDIVLWLKKSSSLPNGLTLPSKYIAVNLAPRWQNEPFWYHWIADELSRLATILGAALVFVPCSSAYDDDRSEHRVVAKLIAQENPEIEICLLENLTCPRVYAAVVADAMLSVAMRLHGSVIAYAQQTPLVALAYHPKISGFVATVRCDRCLLPSSLPPFQSRKAYGYNFKNLGLRKNELIETAMYALEHSDFSMLEDFRTRLADSVASFIRNIV